MAFTFISICKKKWNQVPPIILNLHDKKIKDFKVKIYHLCSGVRGWTENHWRKMDDIYKNETCLSPIPSLAMHCTNVNSIFGLSPNINWKKLWEDNKP